MAEVCATAGLVLSILGDEPIREVHAKPGLVLLTMKDQLVIGVQVV